MVCVKALAVSINPAIEAMIMIPTTITATESTGARFHSIDFLLKLTKTKFFRVLLASYGFSRSLRVQSMLDHT